MRYSHHTMLPERAFQPRATGPFAHSLGMTLEGGGGGGKAPPPDPNIGKAQLKLAQLSEESLNWWKSEIYPDMKRIAEQQEARADDQWAFDRNIATRQQEIAEAEYKRLVEQFYPLQDKLIEDARNYNTAGEQERQSGLAMGDVRDQFNQGRANARMEARSYGIDPTAGRYQGMERAVDVAEAGTAAAAATRARAAAEQLGWAKTMDAIGLGMGQFGNQATSTGLALNASNSATAAGQTAMANYSGMANSGNQAYGSAMSGWNNVGSLGVQKYNADVDAYKARQQARGTSAAGFGNMFGQLGAAGIQAGMFGSDPRVKQNVERIGTFAPLDIGVYSFEYKDEFKERFGHGERVGFMADEVEAVLPDAVITTDDGYKMVNYSMVLEQ
jgi:hypothetical protein